MNATLIELEDGPSAIKSIKESLTSKLVTANLFLPKCRACVRRTEMLRTTVPETTIDEYYDLGSCIVEVRSPRKMCTMELIPTAKAREFSAQRDFRACVLRPDASHDLGTGGAHAPSEVRAQGPSVRGPHVVHVQEHKSAASPFLRFQCAE
jgi:hypothetical protein